MEWWFKCNVSAVASQEIMKLYERKKSWANSCVVFHVAMFHGHGKPMILKNTQKRSDGKYEYNLML